MLIWKLTDNDFLMELPVGMFLLVVLFLFFLFRNLNDSVSRYAACWLCFDFVTVGFAYIYGSKRTALSGLNDQSQRRKI